MSAADDFKRGLAEGLVNNSLNSCARWAEHRIWTPQPSLGPLKFDKFPWQRDILNCQEDVVTIQKAAQMGFSVVGLIKALYMVDQKKTDVLFILPTAGLAGDFTKARLDQMVAVSPSIRNMWKEGNVGLKTTHDHAHIFIRGSVAESGLVSVPVGCAVVDEYDRCNPKAMSLVLERLAAHEEKHFFGLSTPTLPNFGINKQYLLGSMERFRFPCPSCGKAIELLWPDEEKGIKGSIEICGEHATDPDCSKSFFKCPDCDNKLPHESKQEWLAKAYWEATNTQVEGHRSFHLNQMYGPAMKAAELVRAYHKGQSDDAAQVEFVNQKLGEPHLLEGARVTDQIIDQCIGPHRTEDPRPETGDRMIVMGVDVGTFLDINISEYLYDRDPGYEPHLNSVCKVLWAGRLAGNDFSILDRLMAEWQVQYACIDFQPEMVLAKAFARRFHGFASVVQYRKGTTGHEIKEAFDDERVSILTVDRTSFLDMSLGRLHKQRCILPQNIGGVFREHTQNLVRTYEMDELGRPKATYVSLGADHQAHALTLTEVAHMMAYTSKTGRTIKPGEGTHDF